MVKQQVIKEPPSVEETWKVLPWWKKLIVNCGGVTSVGMYSKPGWSGELEFFIFCCQSCKKLNIDYRHGYSEYLSCSHC